MDDGVWSSEEEELNFGGTLGIGSAAAAGLIKSATLVEREQRSALPNQVSQITVKYWVDSSEQWFAFCLRPNFFLLQLVLIFVTFFSFQEIDYGNNTKSNDADINNFLYSDDGPAGGNYNLPEDINDPSE